MRYHVKSKHREVIENLRFVCRWPEVRVALGNPNLCLVLEEKLFLW